MKKKGFILTYFCLFMNLTIHAIDFTIDNRSWNKNYGDIAIKEKAESNISRLLNAINEAESSKKAISYKNIDIQDEAKRSLDGIWENNCQFKVTQNSIYGNALKSGSYFQIHHIEVILTNQKYKGERREREIVITFTRSGKIDGVHLQPYDITFKRSGKRADLEERLQIQNYVERFRFFYEIKDIENLEKIFSEDALIITGTVIKVAKETNADNRQIIVGDSIIKHVRSKKEYIQNLGKIFNSTESIKLTFRDIDIWRHPRKNNIYYVSLNQIWESKKKNGSSYMDNGTLYLVWDFKDPDNPVITVREWTELRNPK